MQIFPANVTELSETLFEWEIIYTKRPLFENWISFVVSN